MGVLALSDLSGVTAITLVPTEVTSTGLETTSNVGPVCISQAALQDAKRSIPAGNSEAERPPRLQLTEEPSSRGTKSTARDAAEKSRTKTLCPKRLLQPRIRMLKGAGEAILQSFKAGRV